MEYTPTSGVHRYDIADLGTTGISNMRVIRNSHLSRYNAGEKYNPEWLDIVNKSNTTRYLNWLTINSNNDTELWADRPLQSRFSYLYGMPYEEIIEICNLTNTNLWYQAPNRIDQTYAEGIAALVRDCLLYTSDAADE